MILAGRRINDGMGKYIAEQTIKQLMALQAEDFQRKLIKGGCFIDVKACFDAAALEAAGIRVWRL